MTNSQSIPSLYYELFFVLDRDRGVVTFNHLRFDWYVLWYCQQNHSDQTLHRWVLLTRRVGSFPFCLMEHSHYTHQICVITKTTIPSFTLHAYSSTCEKCGRLTESNKGSLWSLFFLHWMVKCSWAHLTWVCQSHLERWGTDGSLTNSCCKLFQPRVHSLASSFWPI